MHKLNDTTSVILFYIQLLTFGSVVIILTRSTPYLSHPYIQDTHLQDCQQAFVHICLFLADKHQQQHSAVYQAKNERVYLSCFVLSLDDLLMIQPGHIWQGEVPSCTSGFFLFKHFKMMISKMSLK